MNFQKNESYCGPASVRNALQIYRDRISQKKLADLGGTTKDGSDEEDIKRMILGAGYEVDEFSTDLRTAAWGWAWNSLLMGRPVVLCVDRWEHWVSLVGLVGKNVLLFDPANNRWNVNRNGLQVVYRDTLTRRWEAAKRVRGNQDRFYGIGIGK